VLARTETKLGVTDVALDQREAPARARRARQHLIQVVPVARREVVENDDILIEPQQRLQQVRADEPRRSRNQPPAGTLTQLLLHSLESIHLHLRRTWTTAGSQLRGPPSTRLWTSTRGRVAPKAVFKPPG